MPKLGLNATKRLALPSTQGTEDPGWVDMQSTITVGDSLNLRNLTKDKSEEDATLEGLVAFIKGWNMTDESDTPLPITADNLRLLPAQDFKFISDWLASQMTGAKGLTDDENLA